MTLKTKTLTGHLYLPDGTPMSDASLTFTLSKPASDIEGTGVVPTFEESTTTNSLGSFSVDLWPTTRSVFNTYYSVEATYTDSLGKTKSKVIGPFQLPDDDIEYTLSELLPLSSEEGSVTTNYKQGQTIELNCRYAPKGVPYDLTGVTVTMTMSNGVVDQDFTVTMINAKSGSFDAIVSADDSASLPTGIYSLDAKYTHDSGYVDYSETVQIKIVKAIT